MKESSYNKTDSDALFERYFAMSLEGETPRKKGIRRTNKRDRQKGKEDVKDEEDPREGEDVQDNLPQAGADVNEEKRSFTGTNIKTGEKRKWVDGKEEVEEDSDVEKEKAVRDEWEKGGKKGSLKDAGDDRKDVVEDSTDEDCTHCQCVQCTHCGGSGKHGDETCGKCDGTGKVEDKENLESCGKPHGKKLHEDDDDDARKKWRKGETGISDKELESRRRARPEEDRKRKLHAQRRAAGDLPWQKKN
jgi:hypothetical protein